MEKPTWYQQRLRRSWCDVAGSARTRGLLSIFQARVHHHHRRCAGEDRDREIRVVAIDDASDLVTSPHSSFSLSLPLNCNH
ncbi:hypothetical protein HanIR_Chr08g0345291 [Helianthus annuus]|nr:hypothetical protein HanIR_Chr08g0345291 [Helianthus annuus]